MSALRATVSKGKPLVWQNLPLERKLETYLCQKFDSRLSVSSLKSSFCLCVKETQKDSNNMAGIYVLASMNVVIAIITFVILANRKRSK